MYIKIPIAEILPYDYRMGGHYPHENPDAYYNLNYCKIPVGVGLLHPEYPGKRRVIT